MQFDYTQPNPEKQAKYRKVLAMQKAKTGRLAHLYELAGFQEKANDVASCGDTVELGQTAGNKTFVRSGRFCHDRLCPLCSSRKAANMARQLSYIMDDVEAQHPEVRYTFLTLTMRNCSGDELPDAMKLLTKAWYKLCHHRAFERGIQGWFRSIEITRNPEQTPARKYHPHIHVVLAVTPEYFARNKDTYLNHGWWVEHWQKALGADYAPTVNIKRAYMKPEKRAYYESMGKSSEYGAAVEAAKYPVKDADYINGNLPEPEAVQVVMEYAAATRGRRFTAFGGWLKESARKLKLERDTDSDEDLTDLGDKDLRDDVCVLVYEYHWSLGAKDYVLESVRPSPDLTRIQEADRKRDQREAEEYQAMLGQLEIESMGGSK